MNSISKLRIKYVVLFILILICVFSIKLTNSRYSSDSDYKDDLEIAKPIVQMESDSSTDIGNMLPGDTIEYLFNKAFACSKYKLSKECILFIL